MLAVLIHIVRAVRRRIEGVGHNMSIWIDAFREALRLSAAARRKYPYID